jgi:DNA-binding response OmpR family regulator
MAYQVLLVDDDGPTRSVYHEILARMNFEVFEAEDGVKAIEFLSHYTPNVVVLDLLLPRKSGRDVLDFIYATASLARTRVIIFTAHDGLFPLQLRPGDEFLLKPLNPQILRDSVSRAAATSAIKH